MPCPLGEAKPLLDTSAAQIARQDEEITLSTPAGVEYVRATSGWFRLGTSRMPLLQATSSSAIGASHATRRIGVGILEARSERERELPQVRKAPRIRRGENR